MTSQTTGQNESNSSLGNSDVESEYESDESSGSEYLFTEQNEELIKLIEKQQQQVNQVNQANQATAAAAAAAASAEVVPKIKIDFNQMKYQFKRDLVKVKEIIKDCDPNYIIAQLKLHENSPDRVYQVINSLLESKSYPKLKDFMEKQQARRQLDNHLNKELNMEEFLKLYPDPCAKFLSNDSDVSNNYRDHCIVYLSHRYPYFSIDTIIKVLAKYRDHFAPSFKQLEAAYDLNKIRDRLSRSPNQKTKG